LSNSLGKTSVDHDEIMSTTDLDSTWVLHTATDLPTFIEEQELEPKDCEKFPAKVVPLKADGVKLFGSGMNLRGCKIVSGGTTTAFLWAEADGEIHLIALLPKAKFLDRVRKRTILDLFAFRKPVPALAGYEIPNTLPFQLPQNASTLLRPGLLPDDPDRWPGLHLQGDLGLTLPQEILQYAPPGSPARRFIDQIFDTSLGLNGHLWIDQQDEMMHLVLQ